MANVGVHPYISTKVSLTSSELLYSVDLLRIVLFFLYVKTFFSCCYRTRAGDRTSIDLYRVERLASHYILSNNTFEN